MVIPREILKYCAEEVQRQRDCPEAVLWMVDAWDLAIRHKRARKRITADLIRAWGIQVTPKNGHMDGRGPGGFRDVHVTVGSRLCPPPSMIPRMIDNLISAIDRGVEPDAAYLEFQKIHPFVDGNGRTGKILYNYMKGTLLHPVMPPNFFGCSNP